MVSKEIPVLKNKANIYSSFRDPAGFVFKYKDGIYRQIIYQGKDNFDMLMDSGLYNELLKKKLIIQHEECSVKSKKPIYQKITKNLDKDHKPYKIIKPEQIRFISYPYEWCFSQLKKAALATLEIQKIALNFNMSLRDCSAYNIQFINNSPVLIDTLSFEKYDNGKPWVAYGQFCRHFLAPLVLMKYKDINLNQLLRIYLDGIPLQLCSKLLPFSSYFSFALLLNIHFHSKADKQFTSKNIKVKEFSKHSLLGLIDSMESAIQKMTIKQMKSEWSDYYDNVEYSADSFNQKKKIISELLDKIKPKSLWDIGANTGIFSSIASDKGIQTVSIDADAYTVEKNYNECIIQNKRNILPLCIDINNPTPNTGWNNKERLSLTDRGPTDAVMALALIHHLIIGNNLNFEMIGEFFNKICKWLIIEFVPKEDSQVRQLLFLRKDIFTDYSENKFKSTFSNYFTIKSRTIISGTDRIIYLMQRKAR